jgi:hypothetical protein
MDARQQSSADGICTAENRLEHLPPTTGYGTLGPNSDMVAENVSFLGKRVKSVPVGVIAAITLLGIWLVSVGSAGASWQHSGKSAGHFSISSQYRDQLNRIAPQQQAESLLESAIGNSGGANEEIAKRTDAWRGQLSLDSQLGALTTAALNSNDLRVRQAGIEVQLAAYGLAKNASTVDFLIETADSSGHAQKVWALWALGALANRGVETARAQQALVSHLKDADEDSRRWTVEALALVGSTDTIEPLLQAMHDDPSPAVRERAACGLAESGMLSREQRLTAVPQLVSYTEDAELDSQTHAWAFQALGDITRERLPNDPAAWRSWYASTKGK